MNRMIFAGSRSFPHVPRKRGDEPELGSKTLDRLDSLSVQGEQLKVLIGDVSKLKTDVEEAFACIRKINHRHDLETGEERGGTRLKKSLIWFFERLSIPVLITLCFLTWVGDKFNWFVKFGQLWREFRG